MAQLKVSTSDFYLTSQWRCSLSGNSYRISYGPTVGQKNISFAYVLPAGAIIQSAKIYATLSNSATGIAYVQVNGISLVDGVADVTSYATESGVDAQFAYKTYGAVMSDTSTHMSSLTFESVYLLIEYTMPMSEWSMDKAEVVIGETVTINIVPASEKFTHMVNIDFASSESAQTLGAFVEAGVTSVAIQIPEEWANYIPNALTGIARVQVITYAESGATSSEQNLTLVCPEYEVSASLLAKSTEWMWGILQGQTGVVLSVTCGTFYGASITSAIIQCAGQTHSGMRWTIDPIKVVGEVIATVTVTDSRGKVKVATTTFTSKPYSTPLIYDTRQYRADENGAYLHQGTYLVAGLQYGYEASLSNNGVTVVIKYREYGGTDWIDGYSGELISGGTVLLGAGDVAADKTYEIQYSVTDAFATARTIRTIGPVSAYVTWDPANDAIGFGCAPKTVKTFEISDEWKVYAYGKELVSYTPMRNYVDNGYFLHPVNQRGFDGEVCPYDETLMYLDRWELVGIGSTAFALAEEGVGLHLTGVSTDEYIEIRQRFEDYSSMAGRDFTVVCCIDGAEYHYAFAMGACSYGQELGGLAFFSTENSHIAFRNSTETQVTIEWIALYEGSLTNETLPKYVPKGYGAEFAECSRYFMRVGAKTVDWIARQAYCGFYLAAGKALVDIPAVNVLRQAPVVLCGSWEIACEITDALKLYNLDGTEATITDVTYRPNQNGGMSLLITVDETTAGALNTMVALSVQIALHFSADV